MRNLPSQCRALREGTVWRTFSGQRPRIEWVGMELTRKVAWLYFEVPLPNQPGDDFRLSNRLLFELPKQTNFLTVRIGQRSATLQCSADRPWATLGSAGDSIPDRPGPVRPAAAEPLGP